jgi:Mlc titration factor MtfA (ptsG expression regulator)
MHGLIWSAALALALVLARMVPRWRLKRALAGPAAPQLVAHLQRNLAVYPRMPAPLQGQLIGLVRQFLFEKKFVGCEGLELSEEMRVTIAGYACLLLLNRPSRVYPLLHTVLVYPSAFLVPRHQVDAAGVVTQTRQTLLGESWGDGRVILAWDHVPRGAQHEHGGQNVVLHEFAHQLDSESGNTNGAPYLGSVERYRDWAAVLSRDFASLRGEAMFDHPRRGVIDHYGATSPAEFFAVATEAFFEKPHQMAERHAELFAEFEKYYRVDPRGWLAPPAPAAPFASQDEPEYGQWQ